MSGRNSRYRVSVRQDLHPAPVSAKRLKMLIQRALEILPASEADIRIRIVGDAAIARWNRDFLGKDRPTNVISFPDAGIVPPRGGAVTGDILVSAPTCLAQTEAWGETPDLRVFFFILHGMLHLAGFEHEPGGAERRRMRRKELTLFRRVLADARRKERSPR